MPAVLPVTEAVGVVEAAVGIVEVIVGAEAIVGTGSAGGAELSQQRIFPQLRLLLGAGVGEGVLRDGRSVVGHR